MTNESLNKIVTRKGYSKTPQTQKAEASQVKNDAGGYVFKVDELDQVKRFIILGAPTGFYRSGEAFARENYEVIKKVIDTSVEAHKAVVDTIVEISTEGRAPKQQPGLFALAVASSYGTTEGKQYALSKLSEVARTGTTFFEFIQYVTQFRGWGSALKKAVASWYENKSTDRLATQVVKYKNRANLNHRNVFRLSHPAGVDTTLGNYVLGKEFSLSEAPQVIQSEVRMREAKNLQEVLAILTEGNLTWESVPTEYLNEVKVWETLLDQGKVPMGALIRQLSRLTKIGVISPLGKYTRLIADRFLDAEEIQRSRLHPINILVAQKAYNLGHSTRNNPYGYGVQREWTANPTISEALSTAFKLAFKNVEPANKRTLVALDVSGSMGVRIDDSGLTACEAGSAVALVMANTEPETHIVGFARQIRDLGIKKSDSPAEAARKAIDNNFGSTDAAAAIQYAIKNNIPAETFVIITDNDTYAGNQHVHEALLEYRRKSGIDAKLVVLATTASNYSVGDPTDLGTLNLASWDSSIPKLITEFSRGF